MAVIRRKEIFLRNVRDTEGGVLTYAFKVDLKKGLELVPGPRDGGKQSLFGQADDYLAASIPQHGLNRVEPQDARVPESTDVSNIMDLSNNVSPTLDTPSIIESIVDVLPFRFNQTSPVDEAPNDIVSMAAASAMLGIGDVSETFQDLTELIVCDQPMPVVNPSPLQSPTSESVFSDVTLLSSPSLHSAASTSSDDSHFFSPDFDVLGAPTSFKRESTVMRTRDERRDNRYAEMRRRNNIASKRSRLSRREKEREMEQEFSSLQIENQSLQTKVKDLQELVDKTKAIIIEVVTKRSQR